jgi:Domain of unknown function (DUF4440)
MIPAPQVIAKAVLIIGMLNGCASMQTQVAAETVESIERARFVAMTRQDIPALDRLLASDVLYCHSNAVCEDKAQFLKTIESGRVRYKDIRVERLAGRAVGDDIQIINGTISFDGEQAGQSMTLRLIYTDVYVKRDGRWQLTAWQSTRVQ